MPALAAQWSLDGAGSRRAPNMSAMRPCIALILLIAMAHPLSGEPRPADGAPAQPGAPSHRGFHCTAGDRAWLGKPWIAGLRMQCAPSASLHPLSASRRLLVPFLTRSTSLSSSPQQVRPPLAPGRARSAIVFHHLQVGLECDRHQHHARHLLRTDPCGGIPAPPALAHIQLARQWESQLSSEVAASCSARAHE